MSFLRVTRYDDNGNKIEPKERKPKPEKYYIRPVANPKCDCGDKRGHVYSLGFYKHGKWRTIRKFCKVCFIEEVQEPLSGYRRKVKLGQTPDAERVVEVLLVGYQGFQLLDWMVLKRFQPPRKEKPKVQTIELFGQKVKVKGDYACPKCGLAYGCQCEDERELDLGPPPKEKPTFSYQCEQCKFKTFNGIEAGNHERENWGHRCIPKGDKVRPGGAEKRRLAKSAIAIEELAAGGHRIRQ